jgi:hypothetical protein
MKYRCPPVFHASKIQKTSHAFYSYDFLPSFSDHQVDALSLDVNKPLSTVDGKHSRRNILAKLSPAPSLSLTFLPPSSRSPNPRFETIFLTRSYCLVSPPLISQIFFLSPPSIAFGRTWFGVGRCGSAQPQATENLLSPRLVAQQNEADGQDFDVASTPLICVRSISRRQ